MGKPNARQHSPSLTTRERMLQIGQRPLLSERTTPSTRWPLCGGCLEHKAARKWVKGNTLRKCLVHMCLFCPARGKVRKDIHSRIWGKSCRPAERKQQQQQQPWVYLSNLQKISWGKYGCNMINESRLLLLEAVNDLSCLSLVMS